MGEKFTPNSESKKESFKNIVKNAATLYPSLSLLIVNLIKKRNEKHQGLEDKQSKRLEANKETGRNTPNEQIASQKFNEFFDKINKINNGDDFSYNDGNTTINISSLDDGTEQKYICIDKLDGNRKSSYILRKFKTGKFQLNGVELNGIEGAKRNTVDNLTPEELINDILPMFEKRIEEAEKYKKQERMNKIKEANFLAQAQDQKDADSLLKGLDTPDSLA